MSTGWKLKLDCVFKYINIYRRFSFRRNIFLEIREHLVVFFLKSIHLLYLPRTRENVPSWIDIVPNWFSMITATKIFVPFSKVLFTMFLDCRGAQMVLGWSKTQSLEQDVTQAPHMRLRCRHVRPRGNKTGTQTPASENSATYFCISRNTKRPDQWCLLNASIWKGRRRPLAVKFTTFWK